MLDELTFGLGFTFTKGILKGFSFNFMALEPGFGLVKFSIFPFCNSDYLFT